MTNRSGEDLTDCLRGLTPEEAAARYTASDPTAAAALLAAELAQDDTKIVVLDDDPTGVQTVHGISVFTDFSPASIAEGFDEPGRMFFILTNSRSLSRADTQRLHEGLARDIASVARARNRRFVLISRSDSTMRGHYPLETDTLRRVLEAETGHAIDGEILCPFFLEGGRLTADGVHYVVEQGRMVPAGETEFARDRTFGYHSSDLRAWIEEKTGGVCRATQVGLLPLERLRSLDVEGLARELMATHGFGKVVVDAMECADVEVAAAAILRAMRAGRTFLFRTAAALPRVLGGVAPRALLTREELLGGSPDSPPGKPTPGGLFVIGSHVAKTTAQLNRLLDDGRVRSVEFDVAEAAAGRGDALADRIAAEVSGRIAAGETVAVFTSRRLLTAGTGSPEDDLALSVGVSRALVRMVSGLGVRPRFLVAKGGITSSDIGVRALGVRRATVLGQALPGVPVWQLGPESRFPGMAYVVFPGNVGDEGALRTLWDRLSAR